MQADSQAKFINAVRKLRGLSDLGSAISEGAQAKVEAFADRTTAEFKNRLDENGPKSGGHPTRSYPKGTGHRRCH
jgi:hypothetical protein